MAVSPDDRFAGLLTASAERGGWVPGDVVAADAEGDIEPVEPRRVRLPVLIALAIATAAVLVLGFLVLRPTDTETAPAAPGGAAVAESSPAVASGEVVVHVTGEVENPAVVTLSAGSRVQDAVDAAGGLTPDADAEAVNLARVVADGEQIRIPAVGEAPPDSPDAAPTGPAPAPDAAGGGADASGRGSGGAPPGRIDLNTADATTLQTLPGVGPVTAEAIIAYREQTPFATVDDLLLVKGIGPKTVESLRDRVTVG